MVYEIAALFIALCMGLLAGHAVGWRDGVRATRLEVMRKYPPELEGVHVDMATGRATRFKHPLERKALSYDDVPASRR